MPTVSFVCAFCREEQSQQHAPRTVVDDPLCDDCVPAILAQFENALKSEIYFPPKWGPEKISFESFEDLFSPAFSRAYREKIKEYLTPVPQRVYCQHKVYTSKDGKSAGEATSDYCNTFLGSSERKGVARCGGCKAHWMCMECHDIAVPPLETHTCDTLKAAIEAERESKAFDPALRGKEWQECTNPDCIIKCELQEGCNAMECVCGAEFCFLCGEEAGHESDHWTEGKPCPRFGAVDAPNPIFDRPDPGPIARPGFPAVLINPFQAGPERNEIIVAFAANDQLYMDSEESLTLRDDFEPEQFWMTDAEDNILQPILDMMELLRLWEKNFSWLRIDSGLAQADPLLRHLLLDPVDQAIETTNFFIRDEKLQAKMRETHAAALEISGEDSVLFTMPVMEIFERYNTVHKPKLVEHVEEFAAARDAQRALWAEERERQFADAQNAGRRRWRQEQEQEDDEDRPRRRASI